MTLNLRTKSCIGVVKIAVGSYEVVLPWVIGRISLMLVTPVPAVSVGSRFVPLKVRYRTELPAPVMVIVPDVVFVVEL